MLKNVHISLLGKNEIAREGLRKILSSENFHIRNSSADIAAIMKAPAIGEFDAHVIIVDNGCADEGLRACKAIVEAQCGARLALLVDRYVFDDVASAFQAGVDAVIVKEISCGPLIESISLVAMGEKVFPSQLADDLGNCIPAADNGDWRGNAADAGLSIREIDILDSIMAGMANKVIARRFDICEATVKVHVKAILRKLGVENRTQAATWAVKHSMTATVAATVPSAGGSQAGVTGMTAMAYGEAA